MTFPTYEQRVDLSLAIRALISASNDPLATLLGAPLPPDSPGASLLRGQGIDDSPFIDIGQQLATGVDHLGALTLPLASEEDFGPSIATLARGALEAFARGWWLLTGETEDGAPAISSPELFEARSTALQLHELRTVVPKSRMIAADGTPMSIEEVRAQLSERIASLAPSTDVQVPGSTRSVSGILRALDVTSADAKRLYSQLSSAAHGEVSRLSPFAKPVDAEDTYTNAVPSELLLPIARFTCWGLTSLGRGYTAMWGADAMTAYHDAILKPFGRVLDLTDPLAA